MILRRSGSLRLFGRALAPASERDLRPDWEQADAHWIRRALARSQALPSGGWYVLDASARFGAQPRRMTVAGRQLVIWRAGSSSRSRLLAAADACPHMGAALSEGRICEGRLVCPWHGRSFGSEPEPGYRPLATYDDGYLAWVQLQLPEPGRAGSWQRPSLSERPYLPERPSSTDAALLDAVIRMEAVCEPRDVIANRLDPWHGAHYHPHSFGRLRVIDQTDEAITVRVAYRVAGTFAMEVDARFHCSDPRSIVMTIVAGDGLGSVVETHATPLDAERTAVIELTLASSDRPGFGLVARASGLLRPLMQWAARRLWYEDVRYAERLFALRKRAATGVEPEARPAGEVTREV